MDVMVGGMSPIPFMAWYDIGGGNELYAEMLEPVGIVFIMQSVLAGEDWCYSTKRLDTVDDLRGLKMRVFGEGAAILSKMGVSTVELPGSELYESMSRGVIDLFEYSGGDAAWDMGFHEVIDYAYVSLSRAPTNGGAFAVNKTSWDELTSDLQMILRPAAMVDRLKFYAEGAIRDTAGHEKMRDYGVEVLPLSREIEEEMLRLAPEVYEEKAEDPFAAKVMKSQREFKEKCELSGIR